MLAKVGRSCIFALAIVGRTWFHVRDVDKSKIASLLSAIQRTDFGRLLIERVAVSGVTPSCKELKYILSPTDYPVSRKSLISPRLPPDKIWSTFSAVQRQLTEEQSRSNSNAERLIKQHCRPLDKELNRSSP